jgi:hypothetical protein
MLPYIKDAFVQDTPSLSRVPTEWRTTLCSTLLLLLTVLRPNLPNFNPVSCDNTSRSLLLLLTVAAVFANPQRGSMENNKEDRLARRRQQTYMTEREMLAVISSDHFTVPMTINRTQYTLYQGRVRRSL